MRFGIQQMKFESSKISANLKMWAVSNLQYAVVVRTTFLFFKFVLLVYSYYLIIENC